jgi:hypothetical protein
MLRPLDNTNITVLEYLWKCLQNKIILYNLNRSPTCEPGVLWEKRNKMERKEGCLTLVSQASDSVIYWPLQER